MYNWNKRIDTGRYDVKLYLRMNELDVLSEALKDYKVGPKDARAKGELLSLFELIFRHYIG